MKEFENRIVEVLWNDKLGENFIFILKCSNDDTMQSRRVRYFLIRLEFRNMFQVVLNRSGEWIKFARNYLMCHGDPKYSLSSFSFSSGALSSVVTKMKSLHSQIDFQEIFNDFVASSSFSGRKS